MYRGRIIACITNRRLVKGDFLAQIERVAAIFTMPSRKLADSREETVMPT